MLPLLATAVLEKAINQCLLFDSDTLAKVTALEGKVIALDVQGLGLEIFLLPTANGLRVQSVFEGEPDVYVRAGLFSLARMGLGESSASAVDDGVEIEGDAELGHQVRSILASLDIDWEGQLSRFSGDVIAHQVGSAARGLADWGRDAANVFSQDVSKCLQQKGRDLVVKEELAPFFEQVDSLRADVDSLSQRVARLKAASNSEAEGGAKA